MKAGKKISIYKDGKKIADSTPCTIKVKEFKILELYYKGELIGNSTLFSIWTKQVEHQTSWGVILDNFKFKIKNTIDLKNHNIMNMKVTWGDVIISGDCVMCTNSKEKYLMGSGALIREDINE